jgi:hypothetical protein
MHLNIHHHFPDHNDDPARRMLDRIFALLEAVSLTQEFQMSQIDDFIAQQTAFNTANSEAIATMSGAVDGVSGDIANLAAQIAALQAAAGGLTPEQQAALAAITDTSGVVSAKLGGLSAALAALDALTPPVAPPVDAPAA